jgi:SAM-dependent methyltransferase
MRLLHRKFLTFLLYSYWRLQTPGYRVLFRKKRLSTHLTRFFMYRRIRRVLSTLSLQGSVLTISGRGPILGMLGPNMSPVVETSFPKVDIQALPYNEDSFDVVVSDQVLEHVVDPGKAFRESIRVARPNGIVIHTTCFLNPIHFFPVDLWRFSSDALKQLSGGNKILETGGWGNRSALLLMFMGVGHHLIPEDSEHPLHQIASYNDPRYPIVTWVILRKEG